jgi:hypothetical protein
MTGGTQRIRTRSQLQGSNGLAVLTSQIRQCSLRLKAGHGEVWTLRVHLCQWHVEQAETWTHSHRDKTPGALYMPIVLSVHGLLQRFAISTRELFCFTVLRIFFQAPTVLSTSTTTVCWSLDRSSINTIACSRFLPFSLHSSIFYCTSPRGFQKNLNGTVCYHLLHISIWKIKHKYPSRKIPWYAN